MIDVQTDEVVCEGLSMPHSPRWHNGKLWLLNAGTGYLGRMGIFEVLEFSAELKSALLTRKEYDYLKGIVQKEHFKTLREDAVLKWVNGLTSAEEVFRVT